MSLQELVFRLDQHQVTYFYRGTGFSPDFGLDHMPEILVDEALSKVVSILSDLVVQLCQLLVVSALEAKLRNVRSDRLVVRMVVEECWGEQS